jgi:pyrimidine-nucleoside phosphorylase
MKAQQGGRFLPQWVIERKRDGLELTEDEIRYFVACFSEGRISDAQMSAFAMAVYFQGMSGKETAVLTEAMMHSGVVVDTSNIFGVKVDKHSTGGIGDKVSLVLAPLVASCGVAVPMISGRGLGITGGTLDKLESIPGFRTDLTEREFLHVIAECGCCITGQTGELVPADKKLYALRDVTATVPSIPLIVASIMSKKLAEGIDALVMDVKVGKGAFMKTEEQAKELATQIVTVGEEMGKKVTAYITGMDEVLGRAAGNALEVIEAVCCLQSAEPRDLMDLTLCLGAEMLLLAGKTKSMGEGRVMLEGKISDGSAYEVFRRMVALQGGDLRALDHPELLPQASLVEDYCAESDGFMVKTDAEAIGRACVLLGAGRSLPTDSVDAAVGVTDLVKCGERVARGQPLLRLHANDAQKLEAAKDALGTAFEINAEPPQLKPLVRWCSHA